jgi:hypothetical protein
MNYYAYVPDKDGREPLGTAGRIRFELRTNSGAIRRARRLLGDKVVVSSYTNFYIDETFKVIYDGQKKN